MNNHTAIHADLADRFGGDLATELLQRIGRPGLGALDPGPITPTPADHDRCIGAFTGLAVGDALGGPLEERSPEWIARHHGRVDGHTVPRPHTGNDTRMTLITADALLAGPTDHPARLAARLAGAEIHGHGRALRHTKAALAAGQPWWNSGHPDSAGVAAAARSTAFGLLWAGNPVRAALEAALSAWTTHHHPIAVGGAAVYAAAVALAATDPNGLQPEHLNTLNEIAVVFLPATIDGHTLEERLEIVRQLQIHGRRPRPGHIVNGFTAHLAVPAAIHHALDETSPAMCVLAAVNGGGDADTVGAMTGALVGAGRGPGHFGGLDAVEGLPEALGVATRLANHAGVGAMTPPSAPTADPAEAPDPTAASSGDPAGPSDDTPVNVSFLLDRSGSMSGMTGDVIGGYNEFVANQRTGTGDCTFTAVQFDGSDPFEIIHDALPIADVPDLTGDVYQARGNTPLLDAVGRLIEHVDARVATRTASGVGAEDQIVVVFTDGYENASHTWTRQRLFDVITDRKAAGWTFVFMGANQDSYLEAGQLGFDGTNIQDYRGDGRGTRAAWKSVDRAMREYRDAGMDERMRRKDDYFQHVKEAEMDHRTR